MNYRVFLDSSTQPFLSKFNALPELRPKVKDIIRIGENPILYKITREQKNSQSSVEPFSFDYFVRKLDTSPDSVTMDGSRQSFRKSVLSF